MAKIIKTLTLGVRFPIPCVREIQRKAAADDMTRSQLIRKAVREYMALHGAPYSEGKRQF